MSNPVVEHVTFKLTEGTDPHAFTEAARAASGWIGAQPGFRERRLSHGEDGLWVEHITWDTMEDAKAAAARIGKAEEMRPFLLGIDGPTVMMRHNELVVSAG